MTKPLEKRSKGTFVEASRCLNCWEAPCNFGCPASIDVPNFVNTFKQGDYISAAEIIEKENPFGYICGWICPQENLCQKDCITRELGNPIDIRTIQKVAIEQYRKYNNTNSFLTKQVDLLKLRNISNNHLEYEDITNINEETKNNSNKNIAIIGSGPSGITAALFLMKMGYTVVVFEKLENPGGRITHGIPDFRLPKDIGIKEINILTENIKIEYKMELGNNLHISELFKKGFSAVYIATGKWVEQQMRIEGNSSPNFYCSDDILIKDEWKKNNFHNAVVIGGGNVAIDVARTLLKFRKNSNVFILYRRTSKEMPAWQEEIENAWSEGVIFQFLSQPIKIYHDEFSNIDKIKCSRTVLLFSGRSKKETPQLLKGFDFDIPADMIVTALGFKTSKNVFLSEGLELDKEGYIIIDKNFRTNLRNVFAGGDVGNNRNTVVQAVSDGKRAAISIHKSLTKAEGKNE